MRKLLPLLLLTSFLFGCRSLAPNRMFLTPKDYAYAKDSSQAGSVTYLLQPYDRLELHIFSNDGFRLVDITQSTTYSTTAISEIQSINYVIQEDGQVKLPVIGRVKLQGMSIPQAEEFLEKQYEKYYNQPFVILKVTNRHVLVFQGDGGKGTVVALQNDNTSLFEALALAGGIPDWGHAYSIKIVRGNPKNPEIHLVNVYSLEGLRNSELRILSNDIIYVDAGPKYGARLYYQVTPLVGLLTAFLLVLTLVK